MNKILVILCGMLSSIAIMAEDSIAVAVRPNILDSMPGVEILQDSAVGLLLETTIYGKRELVEIDGYRVQVYSSNQQQTAKTEALDLEAKLKNKVTQTIYVTYLPPFWKVRIGDFKSYDEAREYKKTFVQLFPDLLGDTYIVRDKIKVMQ